METGPAMAMEATVGRRGGIIIPVIINMEVQRDHAHDHVQNLSILSSTASGGFSRH